MNTASQNVIITRLKEEKVVSLIQDRLPRLFQIAELESSRAGKIGMEVGSIRERIIIALLVSTFGKDNVNMNIPITEPEIDVIVKENPISIKTITGSSSVKAVWTVDASSANNFINNYNPKCDIILVQIFWNKNEGGLFYIPLKVQKEIFKKQGKDSYLKMPKPGTNPRGVEFSKEAIQEMIQHQDTLKISINWLREKIDYDSYQKWVDEWNNSL